MEETNFPKIIYKYRNWFDQNHRDLLFKNIIYQSSPRDFNDPFDCRIPINLFMLDTRAKKIKFAKILINDIYGDSSILNHSEHINLYVDRLSSNIIEEQKNNEENHFYMQDKFYGVTSFSTKWNINLMWAHYSNNHKGFCVGFHEEKLRNCSYFGRGGIVRYTNKFPLVDPLKNLSLENAFIETHTKEKNWSYEKEYRLTKTFFPNPATLKDRLVYLDDSFYESITVGINFPESELDCIKNVAVKKKIPLYKIRKNTLSYTLNREIINS